MKTAFFFADDYESFIRKLRRHITRFPGLVEVLAMYFALRDPATPVHAKAALSAALAYFIVPLDLVPDVWLPAGLLDDLAVIAATLAGFAGCYITEEHRRKARETLGIS